MPASRTTSPETGRAGYHVPQPPEKLAIWRLPNTDSHHVGGEYVETFYLPILGPTSLLLLRLAETKTRTGVAWMVEAEELGDRLGVNAKAKHSPMMRSLRRLQDFAGAESDGLNLWALPAYLPMLPQRRLAHLPVALQAEHGEWVKR